MLLKREDGERLAVYIKTRRFAIDGCSYGVEVFGELETVAGREVTRLIQKLSDQAVTDPLTGLFNRRYIDIVLEQQLSLYQRIGQRFGVTQIDIDDFKPVNDAFGHATGDEALRFVATILSDGTRKVDLLARYGSDEFVVVSAVGDDDGPRRLGERALHSVRGSRFVTPSEEALAMTVSIGATLVRPDDESGALVLARADDALYEAKQAAATRSCSSHDPATHLDSARRPARAAVSDASGGLRRDPLSGAWTVIAPRRGTRPHDAAQRLRGGDAASPARP